MKIYKFYKPNCDPCKTLVKMLATIDIPENYEFVELNVEEEDNKQFAYANGINKTPSLMFEDGRKMIGLKHKQDIINFLGGN